MTARPNLRPDAGTFRRRHSLGIRLLLWVGLTALLSFVVVGLLALSAEYQRFQHEKQAEADLALAQSREPLALALWTFDQTLMDLYLQQLANTAHLLEAEVRDPEGQVVAQARRQGPAAPAAGDRALTLQLLAPNSTQRIGELRVRQSVLPLRDHFLASALRTIGFELVKLLVLALGLYLAADRLILRRLRSLARQVEALSGADGPAHLSDSTSPAARLDEIGTLVAAANRWIGYRDASQQAEFRRQQAEAANQAKSEFVSRMSHELRTPLNAILGFAQALQAPATEPGAQATRLQQIVDASWHLARLIDDLLDLSRIEAGTMRLSMESVSVTASFEQALSLVEASAAAAGVQLSVDVPAHARWVAADTQRLRQVLLNLLSNAIKYNHRGGWVRLRAEARDGGVCLRVEDNGSGLSAAQIAQLYVPFNRLGRESSPTPGTGIGLVITRSLVELMGGQLSVSSEPGRGSCFSVQLAAAPPPPALALAAPSAQALTRPATVLYVEDNEVNIEIMRALLAQRSGLRLLAARSLAEGERLLAHEQPDVLLLDMQLPDGSGLGLLQRVRRDPVRPKLPVAIISADLGSDTVAQALAAGADAYLAKPFDFQDTLQRLDALLARLPPA